MEIKKVETYALVMNLDDIDILDKCLEYCQPALGCSDVTSLKMEGVSYNDVRTFRRKLEALREVLECL